MANELQLTHDSRMYVNLTRPNNLDLTDITTGRLARVLAILLSRPADEVDRDVCGWNLGYAPMETKTRSF